MTDLTQQQYQKFLQKKKQNKQTNAQDAEILERAAQIEHQTYVEAKQARIKLQQSCDKQQQTTQLLQSQGEKLSNIEELATSANVNAKEGKNITKQIKDAGKVFSFKMPFVGKIKHFFSKDAALDRKLKKETKKVGKVEIDSDLKMENEDEAENCDLKTGDPVDDELLLIEKNLKNIRQNGDTQIRLLKSHKDKIENINRKNANTEHYINATNHELKKT